MGDLTSSLVKLLDTAQERVVGGGFLACYHTKQIVTCAHVVNSALGYEKNDEISKKSEHLNIKIGNTHFTAEVKAFLLTDQDDIAILEVIEDLPVSIKPVRTSESDIIDGQSCKVYGYLPDSSISIIDVVVLGSISESRVQVSAKNSHSGFVEEGFSGCPVFLGDSVIGMMIAKRNKENVLVAQFCPINYIYQRYPSLRCKEFQHIFLSYSMVDEPFAWKLWAHLKQEGIEVWFTAFDSPDFQEGEENGLNGASGVLAILSSDYMESEYCRRELLWAEQHKIPIYAVVASPIKGVKSPVSLPEKQFDFSLEEMFLDRFGDLYKHLKEKAPRQFNKEKPDSVTRYLFHHIKKMSQERGVQQYIDLYGKASPVRPKPIMDETGYSEMIKNNSQNSEVVTEIPLESITQALDLHEKFILLGNPGAGKTTTIRRLSRTLAKECLEHPEYTPLPFFVSLASWNDQDEFPQFLARLWNELHPHEEDFLDQLKQGKIFLYLDGLNELGGSAKDKIRKLKQWLDEGEVKRVIITCRQNDYDDDLKLPIVTIHELTEAQAKKFAIRYLGEDSAKPFLDKVFGGEQNRSLAQLARTPYLLGALVYLYQNSPVQALPQNNGALSHELTKALWKREEKRNTKGWVPFETMHEALSRLAFSMIEEGKATQESKEYVLDKISKRGMFRFNWQQKALELLFVTERANLLVSSQGGVRFYHQLLQEYFAASRLLQVGVKDVIDPLSATGVSGFRLAKKWDQVVVAACGIAEEKLNTFLMEIAALDPCLAVDCLQSGVEVSTETMEGVHHFVEQCVADNNWRIRNVVVSPASQLGNLTLLHRLATDYDTTVRLNALTELEAHCHSESIPCLLESLDYTRDSGIQWKAQRMLARYPAAVLFPYFQKASGSQRTGLLKALGMAKDGEEFLQKKVQEGVVSQDEFIQASAYFEIPAETLLNQLSVATDDNVKWMIFKQLLKTPQWRDGAITLSEDMVINQMENQEFLDWLSKQKKASYAPLLVRVLESSKTLSPVKRAEMGRVLGELGDPRPGVGVRVIKGIELPEIEWVPVQGTEGEEVEFETDEGSKGAFAVPNFYLAKYLVTQAQYGAFARSDYGNRDWWQDFPEAYRPQPLIEQYHKYANHPRDVVSWYQAVAFTRWLTAQLRGVRVPGVGGAKMSSSFLVSDYEVANEENSVATWIIGENAEIRLPTEWEWQWAAQNGRAKWEYPYGDEFDASKGNTGETGIRMTSAVGIFPQGAAGCGALDMSGNVFEWCLNDYENPTIVNGYANGRSKVLRGGSFGSYQSYARSVYRISSFPNGVLSRYGFRLCLSPIASLVSVPLNSEL